MVDGVGGGVPVGPVGGGCDPVGPVGGDPVAPPSPVQKGNTIA